MPRSRPISGASTEVAVAASAVKTWIASVIASATAPCGACAAPSRDRAALIGGIAQDARTR